MKISVVTPSVRLDGLNIVRRCLSRQTEQKFEWIIVSPFSVIELDRELDHYQYVYVKEPVRNEGDTYGLNKAWNAAFKIAKGDLIVSIVDMQWFQPDLLERLWFHYETDPMKCIGAVGNQYLREENGKPEHLAWTDPRVREDMFYEIPPIDLELCVASLPMKGIKDVGGMDEVFDSFAALSEKEMCVRMQRFGYSFWIDQSIQYRAIQHPRLTKDWDEKYQKGIPYFQQCVADIQNGKRLTLPYLGSISKTNGVSEKEPATS